VFRQAYAAHQEGRLDDAERAYRDVLAAEPRHADAMHLLGVVHHQQGKHAEAAQLMGQAAALKPGDAGIQLNLGNALKALGRLDEAIERFRNALHAQPDFSLAHYNLGNAYAAAQRHADAIDSFTTALRLQPDHAGAYNNLGNSLNVLGRHAEAATAFTQALQLQPDYAGAHNNLGMALNALERPAEAIQHFRAATRADPAFTIAYFNLGNALEALQRPVEAIDAFTAVLQRQPAFAPAQFGLGTALAALGRHGEAVPRFERAVGLDPQFSLAWLNLGTAHYALGAYDAALRAFDQALRLRPELASAHYNRALTLLLKGDFYNGLNEYEWRTQLVAPAVASAPPAAPRWQGKPSLAGATLLIHAEQGLGDTLHFVRWVPHVAALAGHVVLEVQPALVALLAPSAAAWGVTLLAQGTPRPSCDYHCPLLSLPHALHLTLESLPGATEPAAPTKVAATAAAAAAQATVRPARPYLTVPDAYRATWHGALPGTAPRKIGLAWSGRVRARGENRAVPVSALGPLFALEGIDWISLQTDYQDSDRQWLAQQRPACLHLLGERLGNFADTAAVVEQLDAVVCIDTAVAHLAGALGKTTWLMLPFAPDWRWFSGQDASQRQASPWYPAAHLVRQASPGAWDGVLQRVAAGLLA
jgi:tetratricopeptide (TPR) repeat protein